MREPPELVQHRRHRRRVAGRRCGRDERIERADEDRHHGDRRPGAHVVQPDGHQLQGMLAPVAQLAGKGRVLAEDVRQAVDDGGVCRQHAVGSGIALAREGEGIAAVVVGAEEDHQLRLACGLGGAFPDLGIDGAAARVVDVGTQQADRPGPIDGARFHGVGLFQVVLQQPPERSFARRVAGVGQVRRPGGGATELGQYLLPAQRGAFVVEHEVLVQRREQVFHSIRGSSNWWWRWKAATMPATS